MLLNLRYKNSSGMDDLPSGSRDEYCYNLGWSKFTKVYERAILGGNPQRVLFEGILLVIFLLDFQIFLHFFYSFTVDFFNILAKR